MPDERRPSRTGPCAAPAPPASARPNLPPGPTFRSCSPDRVDSRRPLDRLGRYENDCTARACLALLSRSANSGYEAHTSLGAGAGDEGRRRARRRPRHLRRHPAKRPQPATGQPLPRARAPTGRTASWPRPPTPSPARAWAASRQAAKRLGLHRDALKAAFGQWGLPALARRVARQPTRFQTDRAEAERAFAVAERLGSVNAAAWLGTTWPSLRKASNGTAWACPPVTSRRSGSAPSPPPAGVPGGRPPRLWIRRLWRSTLAPSRRGSGLRSSCMSGFAATRSAPQQRFATNPRLLGRGG
jgi:hypothetical protein